MSAVNLSLRRREGQLVKLRRGRIVHGTAVLTGITRLLRDECYPQFDYDVATLGDFENDEGKSTTPIGQEIGRLVDRQACNVASVHHALL